MSTAKIPATIPISLALTSDMRFWNGTAWERSVIKVWNGTAWEQKQIKVYNGLSWQSIYIQE